MGLKSSAGRQSFQWDVSLFHKIPSFRDPKGKALLKHFEKGENAGN